MLAYFTMLYSNNMPKKSYKEYCDSEQKTFSPASIVEYKHDYDKYLLAKNNADDNKEESVNRSVKKRKIWLEIRTIGNK